MTALLELDGVEVRAGGRRILAVEALAVAEGETLAILGANGAGKSTLLRVAGGLLEPAAGVGRLDGSPAGGATLRHASAAVLQRPLLLRASVAANVETGLRFAGVPRVARRRRAAEWLERLGLAAVAARPAHSLSGGEAQRVSLARALVLGRRLLLLDEPFAALDAPARAELLADLRDVLAATGTTALLVTHDRHEAAAVADRTAVLHEGEVRQVGATAAVLDRPSDAACARLVGFENVLAPALAQALLRAPHPDGAAVRAADVRLVRGGADGIVVRVLPYGDGPRAIVEVGGERVQAGGEGVAAGDNVAIHVDPAAARPLIAPERGVGAPRPRV
jgi:ABC-type nitrate/sulfonate/bicarbonate transport system ATPase subunit